ncbi:MAG TPA: ester cyclase [Thermomicrobiales bacterium]
MADDLKALAKRFFEEVWNQGDESAIDRYIAADASGNDPDFGAGREAFRRQWREWRAAFPDLHFEVVDLVAEGDKVVTRWVLTGTHQGPIFGIQPTGRRVRVEGMSLDRIKDGQIIEGFDGWDALGLRRQLGALPEDVS